MARDLEQDLESMNENIENLKNKEFRVLGIKVTFMSVSALLAVLGSILGALYGGFLMYQKVEEVAGLDIGAFEQRMEIIETKLDEAVDYTRDIKSGLKDDIFKLEEKIERMEDKVDESERRMKDTQASIESTLAGVRQDLNQQSKDVTSSIREVEGTVRTSEKDVRNVMKETVNELEGKMDKLDDSLRETLQEALDNPLSQ